MRITRRAILGAAVALGSVGSLTAALLPFRGHLAVASAGVALVVPVVASVIAGGFGAGVVAVVAGVVSYDLVFIPPYDTFVVGAPQNWVALVLYAGVMLIVARAVARLGEARIEARRHEEATRRILALSNTLIADRRVPDLLNEVVGTFTEAFDVRSAAFLLPGPDGLSVVASAGPQLTEGEMAAVLPMAGQLRPVGPVDGTSVGTVTIPLSASERALGVLVLGGALLQRHEWTLLRAYANQVSVALERAQLREQVLRSEILEQVDRWREAMVGAVSHDLRSPLAVIKAAVSDLRNASLPLSEEGRAELLGLVELQADRLDRLVANLLDMSRISAGVLRANREPLSVAELFASALHALPPTVAARVATRLDGELPQVLADHVLIGEVLANLLENADRHAPGSEVIELRAAPRRDVVEVAVVDHGPGVDAADRDRVFQMFNRVGGAGRAGLGLAIAKAFVEADGGTIRIEETSGGGASLIFTLSAIFEPAAADTP